VPTTAREYHDATKHRFDRFARSAGRLDWATQPNPFRRYHGAPLLELPHEPFGAGVVAGALPATATLTLASIGELCRCAFGLSAWKSYGGSRWALRVNPSSGNLHPTEAYILWEGRIFHYAADAHALERRATFDGPEDRWPATAILVGLTSIHWREAWKYGERAYRYCQHDLGHAIGTVRYASALLGWQAALLPWSDADVASVMGVDRDEDFVGAERETPGCVIAVAPGDPWRDWPPAPLVKAARRAIWQGTANVLSRGHVDWPIIDDVARATTYRGGRAPGPGPRGGTSPTDGAWPAGQRRRDVIVRRRSALAFNPAAAPLPGATFTAMLRRTRPGPSQVPWDTIDWQPMVHLVLFVHRVDGLVPGVYVFAREASAVAALQPAMRAEFLWERIEDDLFLLLPTDVTWVANRLSCDQDIASDGFFSLAMLSRFEPELAERGDWFYRRLFWECGLIGQVLYLEAEEAGARATGIGCFYDDPVHEALGLSGHAWQSLYHFAVGAPVEDTRLTTEPGYSWEGVRT